MTLKLKWQSKVPGECDLCENKIKKTFIDGRTYGGQWGYMCARCHAMQGVGLGTGRGQKYQLDSSDNQFYKVGG
jgi:hypothetical protein